MKGRRETLRDRERERAGRLHEGEETVRNCGMCRKSDERLVGRETMRERERERLRERAELHDSLKGKGGKEGEREVSVEA